jgi:mycothiol system anti-sigma-R factor
MNTDSMNMDTHDCTDALTELERYLDRELDADTLTRIETHLKACSPCLEAFDFQAELRKIVARGCREQVPDGLRTRILDALRACEGETDASPAEQT